MFQTCQYFINIFMGCRCCSGTNLDIKYIIFLILLGCVLVSLIQKINQNKKEHIEKVKASQVVQA